MGEPIEPASEPEYTINFLTLRPTGGEGEFVGGPRPDIEGSLFGGHVLSHAVAAAHQDAPEGQRMHSLHGYFLRPLQGDQPIVSTVRNVKVGRSFTNRSVELAHEDAKPAFTMQCSFTADTDGGYEYNLAPTTPLPQRADYPVEQNEGPWLDAWVGPTAVGEDGTRTSTHRAWYRIGSALPDDRSLHAALLAYATDWTATGGRPLQLDGDITGMVSLDHAVWFHRPARADHWHFYDVTSTVNAGGRGHLRATLYNEHGDVVITMAQEMLLGVV